MRSQTPLLQGAGRRGNALFLILIAVALFAALSYAITQSGRSGGGSMSAEQATLYAAQITQIGNSTAQAVTRMVLSGIPATSIVVGTGSGWFPGVGSLNSGSADLCKTGANCLFSGNGGGVDLGALPRAAFLSSYNAYPITVSYFAGAGSYNGVQVDTHSMTLGSPLTPYTNIGTGANDDVISFYPLKKEVCQAINRGLGINVMPNWIGAGTLSACTDWGGDGNQYVYYQILIAN